MTSAPTDTPLATPELVIVALPVFVLHTPPDIALVYVAKLPWQRMEGPMMTPAVVAELTVATTIASQPPTVYVIATVPVATPVNIPVAEPIVAMAGLPLVHMPPAVASVSVIEAPAQPSEPMAV